MNNISELIGKTLNKISTIKGYVDILWFGELNGIIVFMLIY